MIVKFQVKKGVRYGFHSMILQFLEQLLDTHNRSLLDSHLDLKTVKIALILDILP